MMSVCDGAFTASDCSTSTDQTPPSSSTLKKIVCVPALNEDVEKAASVESCPSMLERQL